MDKERKKIVPPRGPATNLRPAGAHRDKRRLTRNQEKQNLEKEIYKELHNED